MSTFHAVTAALALLAIATPVGAQPAPSGAAISPHPIDLFRSNPRDHNSMHDNILEKYKKEGVVRGGITLLPYKNAVALINELRSLNKKVLGIDGFMLSERETEPHMEHSFDCSNASDGATLSLQFLEERKDLNLFFEVVYSE